MIELILSFEQVLIALGIWCVVVVLQLDLIRNHLNQLRKTTAAQAQPKETKHGG